MRVDSTKIGDVRLPFADLKQMLEKEKEYLKKRRQAKGRTEPMEDDSLGLALSGGGIRSATICLGIVEELNKIGLLAQADYLSTVSGGGYLGAYIHAALNDEIPLDYSELFQEKDISHLRTFREYLYLTSKKGLPRLLSKINLLLVAVRSVLLNLLWILVPLVFLLLVQQWYHPAGKDWGIYIFIALVMLVALGTTLGPNFTSPHRFYKQRLSKAYLSRNRKIRMLELNNMLAPYPLINAAVNVNYDSYDNSDISYRGQIKSNYFLFSPLFCGSQVTGFVPTDSPNYSRISLATAMSTSAAAVNTFMGNQKLAFPIRTLLALLNLRTGILVPNPQLRFRFPSFWPYYTYLELTGKPETTTYRVQVSDGGHIENLGIYELLRRKVKVIIAVDAGQDNAFEFSDLRNLVVRANSELGIKINFHPNAQPEDLIRPNPTDGFSKKQFALASIKSMEGAYSEPYEGLLIYIKSSVLANNDFELRNKKRQLRHFKNPKNAPELTALKEQLRRELDSLMYRTYNPDFPHESTSDQFFDEAQWDAYHELGQDIGQKIIGEFDLRKGDTGQSIFQKGQNLFWHL